MKRLRELQLRFQDYLIGINEEVEKDIVSTSDALAEHRLGAYYNAYRIRLIDILALDYSAIETYLGREAFENLALDYLKVYPSKHPSVRWFGQHLSDYLYKHCDRDDHEFLAELAEFEWAQGLVFDAEDEKSVFRLDQMAQIPADAWAALKIQLKPAIHWLDLYWNVCSYSVAIDSGEQATEPHRDQIPVRWLVWRKNRNPNWRSLEVHEAWAIETAHQGSNFAKICEGLCEWVAEDQVSITAAGFLKQWISDELVSGINLPQGDHKDRPYAPP